ncbi:MAG: HAD family hydrolase [candidate division SR1 bacterium]|nr:HAD family hydrolase [candidate division SR1 bacterium]
MNKSCIFDRSGTLNDNFHRFCQTCDLIFKEFNKEPISQEEIRMTFTLPYMKFWNTHLPDLSKEKQDELYKKFIHQVGEAEVYKGVFDMMIWLYERERKLFVVSSDNFSTLLPEIEKAGLSSIFTKIIGEVHEKKDSIISLIKEFNLDVKNTFYVGDTSGDIEAGKSAGVKTIGIGRGYQHKDILSTSSPDFLIDDIVEIKNII